MPNPAIVILRETLSMIIKVLRKQTKYIDEHHIKNQKSNLRKYEDRNT